MGTVFEGLYGNLGTKGRQLCGVRAELASGDWRWFVNLRAHIELDVSRITRRKGRRRSARPVPREVKVIRLNHRVPDLPPDWKGHAFRKLQPLQRGLAG